MYVYNNTVLAWGRKNKTTEKCKIQQPHVEALTSELRTRGPMHPIRNTRNNLVCIP